MELTEIERLQRQVDGLKEKLKDFKLLKAQYALRVYFTNKARDEAEESDRLVAKYQKALIGIADSDELVTAAKLRKYAAKVLGR